MRKTHIIGILFVVSLLVFGACGPPPAPTPTPPEEEKTSVPSTELPIPEKEEYLELTAQELWEKVLDPRLVQTQRKEIWEDQFKGKSVKWLYIYGYEVSGKDITVELNDPAKTGEFEYGDVVWVTGILDSYTSEGFRLRNGTIVSSVVKQVWRHAWNIKVSGLRDEPIVGDLVGADSRYVYFYDSVLYQQRGDNQIYHKSNLRAHDKSNGYFVWEETIDEDLPLRAQYPSNVERQAQEIILEEMQKKVISKGDGEVFTERGEEIGLDGLILKFKGKQLEFYNMESGKLLAVRDYSMEFSRVAEEVRFLVDDGMLFVLGWGLDIYEPYEYNFRLIAYQLGR